MAKSVADYQTAFQNFMEKGARYYACPTGTMLPFAGKTVPAGFLLCNGAEISRTTYARLFSVLGTTWGAGNGSTTFNLPNVNDRCLEGTTNTANVGKYLEAGLPDITGKYSTADRGTHANAESAIQSILTENTAKFCAQVQATPPSNGFTFAARLSNAIYSSSTVQPLAFQIFIIVKM